MIPLVEPTLVAPVPSLPFSYGIVGGLACSRLPRPRTLSAGGGDPPGEREALRPNPCVGLLMYGRRVRAVS